MKNRDTALATLSANLQPIIEKDIRDPMTADHLRQRVLRLVIEMLDDNGRFLFDRD